MAKMGRPKAKEPKDKFIHIRMTKERYENLQAYAAENNLTITEIVYKGLDKICQTTNC